MKYRVYARWPQQRVSHKTVTSSLAVAEAAFAELKAIPWSVHRPIGIAFSDGQKTLKYLPLTG
jgi:hypothetical protein